MEEILSNNEEEGDQKKIGKIIENIEDVMYGRILVKDDVFTKARNVSLKLTELVTNLLENTWKNNQDEASIRMFSEHDIFSQVFNWIAGNKELMKAMTLELLSIYDNILSIGSDSFIRKREFFEPLMLLLLALRPNEKKKMPFDMEYKYLQVLNNLCLRLVDEQFLENFEHNLLSKHGYSIPRYGFFNIIISYIHENNQIGNYARDSLVTCLQVSTSNKSFKNYIAGESDCCNILAAGLSGRYSSLPTTLDIPGDDWYCISSDMVATSPEIQSFVKAIKFCCEVIHFGKKLVGERLLGFIHSGFLNSVFAAALHQPITEAIIAAMAYLELFIREINEKSFMRTLLQFLLIDEYDGTLIIDTLIQRIHSKDPQLTMVTLQLFKTLMDLNCEDVVYHLIIRYLIPCNHVLPNQKRTIKELDFYCKSATMFLYLTPSCCVESQFGEIKDETTTNAAEDSVAKGSPNAHSLRSARLHLQSSFIECLCDARVKVRECKAACQCWSAVYDGMDVMTDLPRKSGSSILVTQSKSERRHSEVFSFANRRNSSISSADTERALLAKTNSTQAGSFDPGSKASSALNGYRDANDSVEIIDSEICLGPFVTALYEELENMMDNSYYINLQLTSLVSRIACYPQPLVRSLLLNSNLVMQPGVKSLFQILTNIAQATDIFVSELDDYKMLLLRARQNLVRRERKYFGCISETGRKDSIISSLSMDSREDGSTDDQSSLPDQNQAGLSVIHTAKQIGVQNVPRRDSLYAEAALARSASGARIGRLHPAIRSPQKRASEQSVRADTMYLRRKNPTAIKHGIYCAILLEEWLKELAAISLEHNLV